MRITDLEAFLVAIPFRAPLISAFGISYPARIRVFIRLHTDAGITGIGETGPDALRYFDADAAMLRWTRSIKEAVAGESPYDFNLIRRKLFHSPDAVAIELACWDIMAKAAGVPLYRLLGRNGVVEQVPVAGYCFFRAPAPDGTGAVTPDNFVAHCLDVRNSGNFSVLKLKLGAHDPALEVPLVKTLREKAGAGVELRVDPNGSWSLGTALRVLKELEATNLQYIEEPIRGQGPADSSTAIAGLRRLRSVSRTPIAADHSYRLDLLAEILRHDAADLALADIFGAGGIENTIQFCQMAGAFGLRVAMHSGTEVCVGQVAKLHVQAALSDIVTYAGDAIYPEYVDGVLTSGKLAIENGMMSVPQRPGLGVELDENKLAQWELTPKRHRELDEFWNDTKASIDVSYPTPDFLMRHY